MTKYKFKSLMWISISLILCLLLLLNSCAYDVESDLARTGNCDLEAVSYSLDIVPIIDQRCNGCHSSSEAIAGVILDSYADISVFASSLECLIEHLNGCSPMPPESPKIPDCERKNIKTWIEDGAPNN